MKVNDNFLKAKSDKHLDAFIVCHRNERTYMYLCINKPKPYGVEGIDSIYVETDTQFKVVNYSPYISGTEQSGKTDHILFHLDVQTMEGESHIQTFLKAIKKDSEVSFYIVAYNGCDCYKEKNLVSHQLYGIVNGNRYLLQNYVGKDNLVSPVIAYSPV